MEPVPAGSVPQDERYLYQVKWDGVRIAAHIGNGRIYLHNRKLRERTLHYPELSRLSDLVSGEAILDGEIVALKEGKPSFPLVLERDLVHIERSGSNVKIRRLISQVPVVYMVFDIIYYNGRDLTGIPLKKRQDILKETLSQDDVVHTVESFYDGLSLYEAISQRKMEGILAKEQTSLYQLGKKHPAWIKIKYRVKQLVVIGGFTVKSGQINALLAGAYHQGQLLYLGRVATGLSGQDIATLTPFLKESVQPDSPFANAAIGKDKVWVTPLLTALVEFQEWTEDLRMRQPVIVGFTKDQPQDCILM
jgi:DNA ligase D-like protein (predicted ligase)